jgi:aspartyl-tRNA(Asn)/glutamyl-tRNA(Gln) amidotransferase subunit B
LFETIIGLEIHVELKTRTKLFCGCSTGFGDPPNHNICPVCAGMPGALPALNEEAVRLAIRAGRALSCRINPVSSFDRKSYFYPDLPKSYQITQHQIPICEGGYLDLEDPDNSPEKGLYRRIAIERIHLEEDAAKLIHPEDRPVTLVDYNRAGIPLIEIVTRPELTSPEDAAAFLKELKAILEYLGVSDCRMEQGSLRCDVNISVRKTGSRKPGTKVEIKNMNSFREIQKALEYEQGRQKKLFLSNRSHEIISETRMWDSRQGITKPMRFKDEGRHYRFFPEPDLPPIDLRSSRTLSWLEENLPELPGQKRERFVKQYGLSGYEAGILTGSRALADYFEEVTAYGVRPGDASNWIITELLRLWKPSEDRGSPVRSRSLAQLIRLIDEGRISRNAAKEVLNDMHAAGREPMDIIMQKNLIQVSGQDEIAELVEAVMADNTDAVQEYKAGKSKVFGFLMGQIMKAGRGRVNPNIAGKILEERLKG